MLFGSISASLFKNIKIMNKCLYAYFKELSVNVKFIDKN